MKNITYIFMGAVAVSLTCASFAYAYDDSSDGFDQGVQMQVTSLESGESKSYRGNEEIENKGEKIKAQVEVSDKGKVEYQYESKDNDDDDEMDDDDFRAVQFHLEDDDLHNDSKGEDKSKTRKDLEESAIDDASKVRSADDFRKFVEHETKDDAHVKSVDVKNGKIEMEYEQPAEIFGFFNTTIDARVSLDEAGNIEVKYPWYSIFMKKHASKASIQSEIARRIAFERKALKEGVATSTLATTTPAQIEIGKANLAHFFKALRDALGTMYEQGVKEMND